MSHPGGFVVRELRTAIRITGAFLACLAAGALSYLLLGHRLLAALHSGEALPFLDRLAGDRSLPL